MAQVTDPIMLDSTGQAIKNSIDLLSANINRTASNIPYDSNLSIKGKIDEIDAKTADDIPYSSGISVKDELDSKVSKTGDTMTDTLGIKPSNAFGAISLGKGSNSSEYGILQMFDDTSHWLNILPSSQTDNRMIFFPNKNGTVALTSDFEWTSLGDITSGGTGVDVSQYNTICILPKMQGWVTQNPQFIPKLPNTASSVAVYVNASYNFSFRINFSSSGVLSIDNEALSGWTSCVYGIFAQ